MICELSGTDSVVNTVCAVHVSVHVRLTVLGADWFHVCQASSTLLLLFLLESIVEIKHSNVVFLTHVPRWEPRFMQIKQFPAVSVVLGCSVTC